MDEAVMPFDQVDSEFDDGLKSLRNG